MQVKNGVLRRWTVLSTVVAISLLTSNCAVFDPYIRTSDGADSRMTCAGPDQGDTALEYACQVSHSIEKARSAIVRTQSITIASLIPLAGAIGYNTARQLNAPSSTAMAAGGLAGYSVVSTLAQPDRVRAYDAGLVSTTCAINVYLQAAAGSTSDPLATFELRQLIETAHRQLLTAKDKISAATYSDTEAFLAEVRRAAERKSGTAYLQSQLISSVRQTISAMNGQLAHTLPRPAESLSGAFAVFSAPPKRGGSDTGHGFVGATVARDQAVMDLEATIKRIEDIYATLAIQPPVRGDFAACAFAMGPDATFQNPQSRFMLGPGDSMNGRTIVAKIDSPVEIRIYGGSPPYSASVASGTSPYPEVTVVSTPEGVASLKVTMKAAQQVADVNNQFLIVVSDGQGQQAKQLIVEAPPL